MQILAFLFCVTNMVTTSDQHFTNKVFEESFKISLENTFDCALANVETLCCQQSVSYGASRMPALVTAGR